MTGVTFSLWLRLVKYNYNSFSSCAIHTNELDSAMHRRFPVAAFALRSRSPAPMPNETGWMHQLSAGEPTAWARLITEWSPRLYHYITANGVSEAEAQAWLSPIFSAVVQKIVGGPPITNLTVLIFATAYPQVMRYCRQQTTISRPKALSASAEAPLAPETVQLRQTLQQFNPEIQQIALLYYLCDVSVAEISQIVHQPVLVIKNSLNQVRRQLCR